MAPFDPLQTVVRSEADGWQSLGKDLQNPRDHSMTSSARVRSD